MPANDQIMQSGYMEVCESSLPQPPIDYSLEGSSSVTNDSLHVFLLRRHTDGVYYDEIPED